MKNFKKSLAVLTLVFGLSLVACENGPSSSLEASSSIESISVESSSVEVSTSTDTTIHVSAVSLSETATVIRGSTTTLVATVTPEDAVDKTVSWSSDNVLVATVDGGVVTGVATGSATITVTTTDGALSDTCVVTVSPISVTGVVVLPESISIYQGESTTLAATVSPDTADVMTVSWASDASSVATVTNGVVTAVSSGSANITATTTDGSFSDTCVVTVSIRESTMAGLSSVPSGSYVRVTDGIISGVRSNKKVYVTNSDNTIGAYVVTTATTFDVTLANDARAKSVVFEGTFTKSASNEYSFASCVATVGSATTMAEPIIKTGADINASNYGKFVTVQNLTVVTAIAASTVIVTDGTTQFALYGTGSVEYNNVQAALGFAVGDSIGSVTGYVDFYTVDTTIIYELIVLYSADVVKANPTSILISTSDAVDALIPDSTVSFAVNVNPNGAINTVTWVSTDESVATVSDGLVTCLAAGTTSISAISTANPSIVSNTVELTVNLPTAKAESVSVNGGIKTYSMYEDAVKTLTAVVLPTDAVDKTVTWTVDDTTGTYVTYAVDDEANTITFTGVSNGTFTVFATADGVESGTTIVSSTIVVTVKDVSEKVITSTYTTGFESAEGFTATSVYNNTTVAFTGPTNYLWGTYYGTPATTGFITGAQSLQMRYYTSAPTNYGYTFTNFETENVSKVEFMAKKGKASTLTFSISISVDGGDTWVGSETFTPSNTTASSYTYNVPAAYQYEKVMIRFSMGTTTVDKDSLIIDDVKIFTID